MTVPLQGFLNAIVYGWTREDFLYIMASTKRVTQLKDPQINDIGAPPPDDMDGLLSDMENSYNYDSEIEQPSSFPFSRQRTPETNMSDW